MTMRFVAVMSLPFAFCDITSHIHVYAHTQSKQKYHHDIGSVYEDLFTDYNFSIDFCKALIRGMVIYNRIQPADYADIDNICHHIL